MGALDGKVAIITGGTSGIGARTAELFVAEGAKVVVAGRRQTQGESLAKALGSAAIFVRTDVTKEGDIKALIEQTLAKFGRLNCLFNNAGNPGRLTSITDLDVDHFDTVIATHLRAVVLGMKIRSACHDPSGLRQYHQHRQHRRPARRLFGPQLFRSQGSGDPRHALRRRGAGREGHPRQQHLAGRAIVTGIFAKGAGLADAVAESTADGLKERFAAAQPLPRAGLPEDIAQAALYLASDAGSFVSGQDLVVDGGHIGGSGWSQLVTARASMTEEVRREARRSDDD